MVRRSDGYKLVDSGTTGDNVRKHTVKGNASWDSTAADECSPHLVNSNATFTVTDLDGGSRLKLRFEAERCEKHDEGGSQLTNTLHGKDGGHHCSTPLGGSESGNRQLETTSGIQGSYSEVMIEDRG